MSKTASVQAPSWRFWVVILLGALGATSCAEEATGSGNAAGAAGVGGSAGAGGGGGKAGAAGSPGTAGGPGAVEGFRPEVTPSGWGEPSAGGLANEGGRCENSPGAIPRKLPITGVEYCVKAHPACATEGTGCPLIVTINTAGALFSRVDGPGPDARAIVVELYVETDGDKIKDKLAELPRVIAQDYPGLDRSRVHAVGWSAGAGAVGRGLCHVSKKSDFSSLGTTSDLYASVIALGGCGCASDYIQLAGNWHVMTFNGGEDPFNGGDSCEQGLRERAVVNGCERPDAAWAPLLPTDPHAANGDGSSNAEVLDFGACKHGDVRGYRGKGEGHVVSFKKNFDPKISGYDTVWSFLQGKTK